MFLFDYIVNLSIFSLLVSTPLVIRSFIYDRPLKQPHFWTGLYAGLVSVILVMLAVKQDGYSYDIRYAAVILVFAYLGPIPGMITGSFALLTRLASNGNWTPAIIGWIFIMLVFCGLNVFIQKLTPLKRCAALFAAYIVLYSCTALFFRILEHQPLFHIQYLLFVGLGVTLGGLLIEANERLRRTIKEKQIVERTLEESESKYRLIADNTSDLIMVLDCDHSVSYFSPSHECLLGFQAHELENAEIQELLHPDDVPIFKHAVKSMFEDRGAQSTSIGFRLKHKEGRWIEFESRCRPVKGEFDRIEHIVIISRDISERKKAEEILLQSEKLSIVGKLAAGVAHEIRNPLTTIKGFLQVYQKEYPTLKYSDLLLSELERIETITSELLSLAKPQAVRQTRTDVKELLEYTIEFLTPQALMNNIQFRQQFEPASFPVVCEENQLKQVFLNILKNAIESMPNGGFIGVSLRKDAEHGCLITIQDEGCGIPEELLGQLGQPFYSLKEKGTGLGLMISHRIIEQHNGTISYRSKINEGTLIEIRLPMAG
ncbi:ATP-binding protein [Paenibacillus thermotolerans]|uniref:ATP-binding protein n=1 Tax=Paenibacillus thermotolerans TaxID=3027807 RepID=UPI0023682E19|nr:MULTISPECIES: ATP-binding protein [unclassified Paenibacillus]